MVSKVVRKKYHLKKKELSEVKWTDILKPGFRYIMTVGLAEGILQQITGINAIYFYATYIFK